MNYQKETDEDDELSQRDWEWWTTWKKLIKMMNYHRQTEKDNELPERNW